MATSSSNPIGSSLSSQRLVGKVALVTGGATGIGESIVRLFHKHGAKVCIVDVQDNLGLQVCQSLGNGPNVCFFHCDVTIEEQVRAAVDYAVEKFGTLDIMVNNAGLSGVIGGLGPHAYTGSKHAVLGLTRNVASELGKYGIRVNCVSPYAVATELAIAHLHEEERTEDVRTGFRAFIGKNANLNGVDLTVEHVANAVLFLASDDAGYISGDNLMVDGEFTSSNHSLRVFR
ncbi:hypothetical protein ES319_A13G015300v1 [Gossypium barbadense]|uniref:Xanthoxin dehydrogenase n=1 Tax=Gossypium barbadense TaxID=3634 RepID=A0A5J5STR3_GOSBA|nr:hypothetical protein ES319_A13G015300v1 [Gossypium barbadense]